MNNYIEIKIETLPNKTRDIPVHVDGELKGWLRVGDGIPVHYRPEAEVVQGETELDRFKSWAEDNKNFSDSHAFTIMRAVEQFREANE